jgi:hypothetical protein
VAALTTGAEAIASVATADGQADVAAVVISLDPGLVTVRLRGFLPAGYEPGDVLSLLADRVRPVEAVAVVSHRDGLVAFEATERRAVCPTCDDDVAFCPLGGAPGPAARRR